MQRDFAVHDRNTHPFLPLTSVELLVTPDPAHYRKHVSQDQLLMQYILHFITFRLKGKKKITKAKTLFSSEKCEFTALRNPHHFVELHFIVRLQKHYC